MNTTITRRLTAAAAAILACLITAHAPAEAQIREEYRVPDVIGQFHDLKHHGEAMAFHPANLMLFTSWVSKKHIQGMARTQGPGRPFLFISQSGELDTGNPANNLHASILIVRMDSRDHSGERFRSNRLHFSAFTEATDPPPLDRAVARIDFTNSGGATPFLHWAHAGNLALIDDVLITPLEDKLSGQAMSSGIAMFDVRNPEEPEFLYFRAFNHAKAGTCAITRLDDGRYLLIVGGVDNGATLVGYRSTTTNLRDPALDFQEIFAWHAHLNAFGDANYTWPLGIGPCFGKEAHQNYTFIRQNDGKLFLLGTTRVGSCGAPQGLGDDVAELFEVIFPVPGNGMHLLIRGRKHLYSSWPHAGFNGNFIAAGYGYVSPTGNLILYGAPHSRRSLLTFSGPVDFVEFRNHRINRFGSAGPSDAFLELYDDTNGWSGNDRSLVWDYRDRSLEPWHNLGFHDDFNDRTSAVVWSAPVGAYFTLWDNSSFGGNNRILLGTGAVQYLNLNDVGFGDKTTSISFSGSLGTTVTVGPLNCPPGSPCVQAGTPQYPVGSIHGGLSLMVNTADTLQLIAWSYNERPTIARPMTIRSLNGSAIIGQ